MSSPLVGWRSRLRGNAWDLHAREACDALEECQFSECNWDIEWGAGTGRLLACLLIVEGGGGWGRVPRVKSRVNQFRFLDLLLQPA